MISYLFNFEGLWINFFGEFCRIFLFLIDLTHVLRTDYSHHLSSPKVKTILTFVTFEKQSFQQTMFFKFNL